MPGSVNNNLTDFIQTASRLGGLRNAERLQQVLQQTEAAGQTGGADLARLRELDPQTARAVENARGAQAAATEAQAAGETLRNTELQIRELRSLAQQASNADISTEDRAALAERFNALQAEINTATEGATLQGQTLNERLAAPPPAPADTPETPAETPAAEAEEGGASALAFDIGTAEGAAAAVSGLEDALDRVAEVETETQSIQTAARQATADAFAEMGTAGTPNIGTAQNLDGDLRTAILQQAATSLLTQGGLSRDSIMMLLG